MNTKSSSHSAQKIYQMPIAATCPEACDYCPGLGCLDSKNRQLDDIDRALKKAKSGEYKQILLPCNSVFQPGLAAVIKRINDAGMQPLLQLNSRSLHSQWKDLLSQWHQLGSRFLCILDSQENLQVTTELLAPYQESSHFLVVGRKNLKLLPLLSLLSQEQKLRAYFYFPYKLKADDGFLSCEQIQRLLQRVRSQFPELEIKTLPGLDIFDPRVAVNMDLEPLHPPTFSKSTQNPDLQISVVIPSYNNKSYLKNTVRHLLDQDLDKNQYEIVVVDDGSDDGSDEAIIGMLNAYEEKQKVNFKYVFFPRKSARKMGDGQFRAGVARNLGVKNSSGRILAFLDSDILTPPHFLRRLLREHEKSDLIQTQRLYLKKDVSSENTSYDDILPNRDTFIPEGGYWHKFYQQSKKHGWMNLDFYWKYVCTYSLSLSRELFEQIGWFRKNYIFYGFEDTELGFRLAKAGATMHLSDLIVWHLYHETGRSEFFNSDFLRQALLKKTGKIFYHAHLDHEIYEHFNYLMPEDISFKTITHNLKSLIKRDPSHKNWLK